MSVSNLNFEQFQGQGILNLEIFKYLRPQKILDIFKCSFPWPWKPLKFEDEDKDPWVSIPQLQTLVYSESTVKNCVSYQITAFKLYLDCSSIYEKTVKKVVKC